MFDFVGKRKLFFSIAGGMFVLVILCSFLLGPKLDIQFKGGSIATYSYEGDVNADSFQKAVEDFVEGGVSLQHQENTVTGRQNFVVSLSSSEGLTTEKQNELIATLQSTFPEAKIEAVSVNNVDPVMGKEFLKKCVVAVIFAAAIMILYIGIRFRKIGGTSAGVVAVVSLLHDVFIAYGVFVVLQFPINDNFIAVVLTILGYSINDTIVIYDRVRENKRYFAGKITLAELVNKSINQCLRRSITTSLTTAFALLAICIVAVAMNVTSILTFAVPMMVGVICGLYSSVFISGPLWVFWQEKKAEKAGKKAMA